MVIWPAVTSAQQFIPIDSTLAGPLLEAVSRSNPGLVAQRSSVAAAQSRFRAAGFAAPAVLSGEIEDVPGGTDFVDAGFRLEVGKEFLTGGRSAAARALAAADVQAAEAALYAAELRTRAVTMRALTQALGWSAVARRLAAEDSLLIGAETSLRSQFAVGDARYTDVLRLRTERLRVQTERAEALAEARVGLGALEALLGNGVAEAAPLIRTVADAGPTVFAMDPLPSPPNMDSLIALSGRVRLAQTVLEHTQAARDAVRAAQNPRIAGALGIQRIKAEGGGFAVGPTRGVSVTLPFTAREANHAAAEAAELAVAAAQAELAAARAGVRADLIAARTRYEAGRERLAVFDAALLRGVRQERESALAAYRTGELSLIELLDFERALARAEIAQRRARMEAVTALTELIFGAAGAPNDGTGGISAF
ncbi:MAG TPA: TolC family protein [Longimicrobiaceae bacterium]|nr:TolC family protein [Longimicrobiaceae bacterium]